MKISSLITKFVVSFSSVSVLILALVTVSCWLASLLAGPTAKFKCANILASKLAEHNGVKIIIIMMISRK